MAGQTPAFPAAAPEQRSKPAMPTIAANTGQGDR
jgi:hypothetical protein